MKDQNSQEKGGKKCEVCPKSKRADGEHGWQFWGDDPYIFCSWCDEMRDAISGFVVKESPYKEIKVPSTPQPESEGVEFEKCTHDDCLRDGATGVCREREEDFLLDNWKRELKRGYRIYSGESAGHYLEPIIFIEKLLQAQAKQIRRDERERAVEILENYDGCNAYSCEGPCSFCVEAQAKILNSKNDE